MCWGYALTFFLKDKKESRMTFDDVPTANKGDVILILRAFYVIEAGLGFWPIFTFEGSLLLKGYHLVLYDIKIPFAVQRDSQELSNTSF